MNNIITAKYRKLAQVLFSNELLIMLLLFPFFKTSGFNAVPGLSFVCNALIFCEFVLFFALVVLEKKLNPFFLLIIVYEIWNYVVAPVISGNEMPSLFYVSGALGILSIFTLGFSYNYRKFLKALSNIFTVMISANLLLMLIFPSGLMPNDDGYLYLFGLRVGFSLFIIPGLMFNCVYDDLNGKLSIRTLICFCAGVISLLMKWVATGIIEMTVIILWIVILKYFKFGRKFSHALISVCILFVNFFMTFVGTDNIITRMVVSILNKNITFSGRTEIWAKVIDKLASAPLTGYGLNSTVLFFHKQRPAHNQWLHFAFEGGYTAMLIVLAAVLISSMTLTKCKKESWYATVSAFSIGILIGCIAEIQTYIPFFYAVFMLPILLKKYATFEGEHGIAN